MLDYSYTGYKFAAVEKLQEFYKDSIKLPETTKIKAIIGSIRGVFKVPLSKVKLYVAEGARVYRFEICNPHSVAPIAIGAIYYLPLENRLELFDYLINRDIPMIQWKNKKVVSKGYSFIADLAGYDKLFQPIILSS